MMGRLLAVSVAGMLAACQQAQLPGSAPAPEMASVPTAQDNLDRMDTRKPVPLLPMMANHQKQNMRDHLLAVQEIVLAANTGDFAGVEKAAARIGYSEQMGMMCTHMGAGAPGFTDMALNFHHTADTIGAAARKKDKRAVMTALGNTLQTCTACHTAYKQSVVDEATWTRLTSSAPPSGQHMPH